MFMLKKSVFSLVCLVAVLSLSSLALACEGVDCTHNRTNDYDIVSFGVADLDNNVPDEIRELLLRQLSGSMATDAEVITISRQRIYANEHVFGENELLDELFEMLFSCGRMFVEFHITSVEYLNENGVTAFSSSQCSPGNHTNVSVRYQNWWLSHVGWRQHNIFHGGNCTLIVTSTWTCLDCGTTGVETSVSFVFCRDC
jgi:hypothetical protein